MESNKRSLWIGLAAVALAGCGTTLAPKELLDAREAYKQAEASPARQLAPAALDDARQALDRAEGSFRDDSDSQQTKNLAYIANRRALIAAAVGRTEAAVRDAAAAEKERQAIAEQVQEATEARLNKTKAQLDKERRAAERAAEDAKRREKDLKADAAKTKAELAKERKARLKLEKKYAAALASLAEVAKVKEEKRGVVITLSGSVLFATGKWELLPVAQSKLADVAKAVKDQGYKSITVEGHTDSRGSASKNRELSLKRANSVRSFLISKGLKGARIKAVGIGEDRPVATNKTAEGRANNRRVELIVVPED